MIKESRIIQLCVAFSLLLLPFAHLKVVFLGVPLYSVEIPILVTALVFLWGIWKHKYTLSFQSLVSDPFFLALGLFSFGVLTSFLMNGISQIGLGMIKTWFIMPFILLFAWLKTHPSNRDIDILLLLWLGTTAIVSFLSNIYFFQGIVTFDGRLSSWYASPNYLAFFITPGILLAQYFLFHPTFQQKKWMKRVLFFIILTFLITLFATRSYSAWVAVLFSSTFFLLFLQKTFHSRRMLILFFSLLIITANFFFFEKDNEKWQSLVSLSDRSSMASRMMIWKASYKMIKDSPLFGIGIGRFQEQYLQYQIFFPPYLEWAVPEPHNLYLAILLQSGMIGFIGFLSLLFFWLSQAISFLQRSNRKEDVSRLMLLISILSSFLIIGIVDTPFFKTDIVFSFWYILFFGKSLISHK